MNNLWIGLIALAMIGGCKQDDTTVSTNPPPSANPSLAPDTAAKVVSEWKFDWTEGSKQDEPKSEDKFRIEFKADHTFAITGADPLKSDNLTDTGPWTSGKWTLEGDMVNLESPKPSQEVPTFTIAPEARRCLSQSQ